jgi:hypothetical protein
MAANHPSSFSRLFILDKVDHFHFLDAAEWWHDMAMRTCVRILQPLSLAWHAAHRRYSDRALEPPDVFRDEKEESFIEYATVRPISKRENLAVCVEHAGACTRTGV